MSIATIRIAALTTGVCILAAVLVGCATPTSPIESHGAVSTCPNDFSTFVQKEAMLANKPGDVRSVGVDSVTDFTEIAPLCVTARAGDRVLPSGSPEPVEYVALYQLDDDSLESIVNDATAHGFTITGGDPATSNRVTLTRGHEFLTLEQREAAAIGITGSAPYALAFTFTSEEIAKLRAAQ